MPKLPIISGDDCIKALSKIGYRIEGSVSNDVGHVFQHK
jgi:predicted RNA binding protein YcfA (HicA-like mRNA interferase family)